MENEEESIPTLVPPRLSSPITSSSLPCVEVYAGPDADASLEPSRQLMVAKSNGFIHKSSVVIPEHSSTPSDDFPRVYIDKIYVGGQTELDHFLGIQELIKQSNRGHKRLFLAITVNWCGFCTKLKNRMHWYKSKYDGLQMYTTENSRTLCLTMTDAFQLGVLTRPPTGIKIMYPTILEYIPDGEWIQIDLDKYEELFGPWSMSP